MVVALDDLPDAARALVAAFHDGLRTALRTKYSGLYLYGAACFPPSPVGDVDFHVLVSEGLNEEERTALEALHARLASELPLGDELDGYYITLDDASRSELPESQHAQDVDDEAWALHRAHIHAGRFVLVHGPDPRTIVPEPTWQELDTGLQHEFDWLSSEGWLEDARAYCVLNLCRILYSFETRDVVLSKFDAARWAFAVMDTEWHELVRAAMRFYLGTSSEQDATTLRDGTRPFWELMRARIASARGLGVG